MKRPRATEVEVEVEEDDMVRGDGEEEEEVASSSTSFGGTRLAPLEQIFVSRYTGDQTCAIQV